MGVTVFLSFCVHCALAWSVVYTIYVQVQKTGPTSPAAGSDLILSGMVASVAGVVRLGVLCPVLRFDSLRVQFIVCCNATALGLSEGMTPARRLREVFRRRL